MAPTVVIVGSSVGGVRTAQALRAEGHDGPIVLVGSESELPYDKPPLSKQFLAGIWETERITLLRQAEADSSRIQLRLGVAAERLNLAAHEVVLVDGSRIPYDIVVLATGSAARPSPWVVESGIHVVRSLDDSHSLRAALIRGGTIAVVGGGFIGAEVAATASAAGRHVVVIDPLPSPIGRLLGPEIGELFGRIHANHGVDTRFGVGVAGIQGRAGDLRITLTDGEVIVAATCVVGIGATPNVGWLESSGLLIQNGVVCDQFCKALDHSDVFAAGDIARWFHPGHGELVRVEHWTNAVEQAACVAHNITHPDAPRTYRPTEFVWSDQYDWKIQIVGRPAASSSPKIIGDPIASPHRFAVLYRGANDSLGAAVTVNWPKALLACRRMVATGAAFESAAGTIRALAIPAAVL